MWYWRGVLKIQIDSYDCMIVIFPYRGDYLEKIYLVNERYN